MSAGERSQSRNALMMSGLNTVVGQEEEAEEEEEEQDEGDEDVPANNTGSRRAERDAHGSEEEEEEESDDDDDGKVEELVLVKYGTERRTEEGEREGDNGGLSSCPFVLGSVCMLAEEKQMEQAFQQTHWGHHTSEYWHC